MHLTQEHYCTNRTTTIEACKLVVHRRRQIGSLHSFCYNFHLHWTANLQTSVLLQCVSHPPHTNYYCNVYHIPHTHVLQCVSCPHTTPVQLTEVYPILGKEDGSGNQVEATPHHVSGGEGGAILLPRAGGVEHTPIVGMVTITVLLPACAVGKEGDSPQLKHSTPVRGLPGSLFRLTPEAESPIPM